MSAALSALVHVSDAVMWESSSHLNKLNKRTSKQTNKQTSKTQRKNIQTNNNHNNNNNRNRHTEAETERQGDRETETGRRGDRDREPDTETKITARIKRNTDGERSWSAGDATYIASVFNLLCNLVL